MSSHSRAPDNQETGNEGSANDKEAEICDETPAEDKTAETEEKADKDVTIEDQSQKIENKDKEQESEEKAKEDADCANTPGATSEAEVSTSQVEDGKKLGEDSNDEHKRRRRRRKRSRRHTNDPETGDETDNAGVPDESRPTTAATTITTRNVMLELLPLEDPQSSTAVENNCPELATEEAASEESAGISFLITVFSVNGKGDRHCLGQAIAPLTGLELNKDIVFRRPLADLTQQYRKHRESLVYAHLLHELRDAYVAHTVAKAPQAVFGGALLNENKKVKLSCRKAGCSSKRVLYNGKLRSS